MIQKIAQRFDRMIHQARLRATQPIGMDSDVKYEAGFRIGVVQGMEQAKQTLLQWHQDEDTADKDL